MANSQKKGPSSVPVLVVLAIIAGAVYISRSPLESSRPKAPAGLQHPLCEGDKIEARLWQDPLKAALDHKKSMHDEGKAKDGKSIPKCPSNHGVNQVSIQIKNLTDKYKKDQNDPNTIVHVLLTIIRDDTFAEDHERRLRNRYAVLTALRSSGFTPEDAKHIQYCKVSKEHIIESTEPLVVPFEWFEREPVYPSRTVEERAKGKESKDDRPERVLVVWLARSVFSTKPLTRLAQLINELDIADYNNVKIDVIGPSRSTTLRTMLEDVDDLVESGVQDPNNEKSKAETNTATRSNNSQPKDCNFVDVNSTLDRLTIFSPWSTASPALLVDKWDPNDSKPGNSEAELFKAIPKEFRKIGVKFVRTIGSDDLLAMHLIQELDRRGVDVLPDPNGEPDHIALISEWDTFYGKAFPLTFATVMESIDPETGRPRDWNKYAKNLNRKVPRDDDDHFFPKNLRTYSYIRGIDGVLPESETPTEKQNNQDKESQSKWTYSKSLELPVGRGQLDYVRRLAQNLRDEYKPKGKKLRAIGVVGSDVYDKLVLLHALREQFSDVIFFMTDMDARLLHHEQFKWTRNVIVASNYGLELNEYYQRDIYQQEKSSLPPFRDNYQTSLFFACRTALGLRSHTGRPFCEMTAEELTEFIAHPRLFEIGRGRAVNLTVLAKGKTEGTEIHPHHSRWLGRWTFLWRLALVLPAIGFCVLLLVRISLYMQQILSALSIKKWDIAGVAAKVMALVLIAFIAFLLADHYRERGEPFSLFKGVSIWPGEILRLLVVILSLYFLIKSKNDLEANEIELCEWFNPKDPNKFRQKSISYKRSWVRIYNWEAKKDTVEARHLWKEYLSGGSRRSRIRRLIPMVLVYILLAGSLMLILEIPNRPYRGNISSIVDIVVLFLSVFSMIVLIFFVLDATRLSLRFIRNLKDPPTDWGKFAKDFVHKKDDKTDGLAEWLDVKFIASHTEAVGKLIYYPFIVLLIMFAARNRYFDNWNFPTSLIIIFLVNSAYALLCALMLRHEAEKARRVALDRLKDKLVMAIGADGERRIKQLETMIEDINSLQKGAFSSFLANPVIHVLLGSGGAGLIALMKYMPLF